MKFDQVIQFLVDGKRSKLSSNLHLINDSSWRHSHKKRKLLPVSCDYDGTVWLPVDYWRLFDNIKNKKKILLASVFLLFPRSMSSHNTTEYCFHGAMWSRDAMIKQYQHLIHFWNEISWDYGWDKATDVLYHFYQ